MAEIKLRTVVMELNIWTRSRPWPREKQYAPRELQDKAFKLCCQFMHSEVKGVRDSPIKNNSPKQILHVIYNNLPTTVSINRIDILLFGHLFHLSVLAKRPACSCTSSSNLKLQGSKSPKSINGMLEFNFHVKFRYSYTFFHPILGYEVIKYLWN